MLNYFDHLSVWEIAHRWHDVDPNKSEPLNLQLDVQDTIRFLCKGLVNCEISVSNSNGVVLKNPQNALTFESYIKVYLLEDDENYESTFSENEKVNHEKSYESYISNYGKRHLKLVDKLEQTYNVRVFDRGHLERVHINQENLLQYCEEKAITPPSFWFSAEQLEQYKEDGYENVVKGTRTQSQIDEFWNSLNHKQKARIMSQEVAKILWKDDPTITIESLKKHSDILKFGMAANYAGEHTIRGWIAKFKPNKK